MEIGKLFQLSAEGVLGVLAGRIGDQEQELPVFRGDHFATGDLKQGGFQLGGPARCWPRNVTLDRHVPIVGSCWHRRSNRSHNGAVSQISLQALSAIDLFAVLPPSEREHLASMAVIRRFEAKETLFDEGRPCEGIWVIASGSVRVYKFTPGGRQIVLAVQEAPATVAEVPVFDGGPYPASVITQEPSEAMLIRKDDFLACCRRNPELTLKFLSVFSARLRHLVGFVERVTFGSIRQRLAQALIEMADTYGSAFAMPETHEDLANRLGTVREVVSRNLGRFQSEGLIRLHRRDVQILNRAGLAAEAETNF